MEWTATEQAQLHAFLVGFTSPDPAVQASNLVQLEALSQYPAALVSTLAAACDETCSVAVRLSATTVARQLLRPPPHRDTHRAGHCSGAGERLSVYLASVNARDPSAAASAVAQALLDAALRCSGGAPPLRRALSGLVAALLRSLAEADSWPAASRALASVWSVLLRALLQLTDSSMTATCGQVDAAASCEAEVSARIADRAALCASLLREVCETTLPASPALTRWIGEQADECLAICTLLAQLLQLFAHLRCDAHNTMLPTHGSTACSLMWLDDVLAAFLSCVESGVLPCAPSNLLGRDSTMGLSGTSHSTGEGPAAEALRSVSAAVLHVHRTALHSILHDVLGPLHPLHSRTAHQSGDVHAATIVTTAAPLVAVAMRYVVEASQFEVFAPVHSDFIPTAAPLLAVFCHIARVEELQYDGAGEPDSVHAAVVACVNCTTEWAKLEGSELEPCTASERPLKSQRSRMDNYASTIFSMLVDAATLPPAAVASTLVEQTTHLPDGAAELLVKSASGRRRLRGRQENFNVQHTQQGSAAVGSAGDDSGGVQAAADDGCDAEDDVYCADVLDAALPDNGTLRQAVAWCAASLSCHPAWLLAVSPQLARCATTTSSTAALTAAPGAAPGDGGGSVGAAPSSLANACGIEALMFVQNELVDSLISDTGIAAALADSHPGALAHSLATQLQHAQRLLGPSAALDRPTPSAAHDVPFFVRVQAVRYAGRLSAALLDAWRSTGGGVHGIQRSRNAPPTQTPSALVLLHAVGGLDQLLAGLLVCLTAEVNKAVQVECIRALDSVLTSCLRAVEASLEASGAHGSSGESELEEESLDDTSSDSGNDNDAPVTGHLAPPGLTSLQQADGNSGAGGVDAVFQCAGIAADLHTVVDVLRAAASHLGSLQWSVRHAVYHLFSDVVPMALRVASLMGPPSAASAPLFAASVHAVTADVLEALARHYAALQHAAEGFGTSAATAPAPPLLEMATLLTTMADVTTAMDGGALERVVSWILHVAHAVLNLYAQHLSQPCRSDTDGVASAPHGALGRAVEMSDMAMVSLDLVSCVCDRMIDRDALLMPSHGGQAAACSTSPSEIHARLLGLATVLLHSPVADLRDDGARGVESLPNRCMALLALCQASADHPCSATAGGPASNAAPLRAAGDTLCEVRRSCFAVLYDCVFLVAYPASLFQPTGVSATVECGGGLPDALGRELFSLCLRELLPASPPAGPLHGCAHGAGEAAAVQASQLRARLADSAAASDAWLCLGTLLSLWDQQHWQRTRGRRDNSATPPHRPDTDHGPCSVFFSFGGSSASELRTRCLDALHGLLTALLDTKASMAATLRLNMTSAACGLALVLLLQAPTGAPPGTETARPGLCLDAVSAVFSVASSACVQSYAAGATRGDASGISEAAHLLWCVGRVWQEAAASVLPHDVLLGLVQRHGRELAKTTVWWTRCAHGAAAAGAASVASTPHAGPAVMWGALAELWRPLAETLLRAAAAGALSLAATQLAALRHVEQLQ